MARLRSGGGAGRVVLAGAGHAHLHALVHAAEFSRRGHELVVVAPGPLHYSGLATGVLGGAYPPALACIDVAALAARGGARFLRDCAVRLDPAGRTLFLRENGPLSFDVLSLDLGGASPPIPGEREHAGRCFPAKPIGRLLALRPALLQRLRNGGKPRVVVAGGGASACEIAANLLALARRASGSVAITMLAGGRVLDGLPAGARRAVSESLVRRGVRILPGERVVRVEDRCAVTAAGTAHPCDLFVNATGLAPHPLGAEAGLPARNGATVVDRFLRSPAAPAILGAGDCVSFGASGLPRAGVHAVRQGPVLLHNLLAAAEDGTPEPFRPQRRHLWIMNLGDGTGLAVRGTLWWHGRLAMLLKDRIDRRFVDRYGA